MARKIKVGDWAQVGGLAFQVKETGTNDETLFDGRGDAYHAKGITKLPASPAVLAKSHRLLMRLWKTAGFCPDYIDRHCRRIAKGKGKK